MNAILLVKIVMEEILINVFHVITTMMEDFFKKAQMNVLLNVIQINTLILQIEK